MNTRIKILLVIVLFVKVVILTGCSDSGGDSSGNSGTAENSGTAGSQSRFAIVDGYLYTIAGSSLRLFDLQDPSQPAQWAIVNVAFGIETVFSYQNHLYLGAIDGVYIYDNTDPEFPEYRSKLIHQRGCDPVVVQGDYAFVTLRGSGRCGSAGNQLDVIDISDPWKPLLKRTYAMLKPSGLGIDGNRLFVCDGPAGLKVLDSTDPLQLESLETLVDIDCFDVIPNNNILLISDELGLLQYDYTDLPMQLLSEIPVTFY